MNSGLPSSFEHTLPDLLGTDVRLLFVGVNPSRTAVAAQAPFAGSGNRFYAALHFAGVTDHVIQTSGGLDRADREYLFSIGIGITCLVTRATASAVELGAAELVAGAISLSKRVARVQPKVVAILGITAFRAAFKQQGACVGRQPCDIGVAQLWVVPNPSGRNVRTSTRSLAAAYREVAIAAGLAVS
jgi:TDG/mug DNA glycosylase family protein